MSATHPGPEVLNVLFEVLKDRKATADTQASYTARLLAAGTPRIAQKVGEEAVEVALAAVTREPSGVAEESADLLYHLLVLWLDRGVDPQQVWDVLARRAG